MNKNSCKVLVMPWCYMCNCPVLSLAVQTKRLYEFIDANKGVLL